MTFMFKSAALAGVSAIAVGAMSAPAGAQQASEQAANPAVATADRESEADAIIVTGSRLRSDPNATAPLPITTVDAAQLRALGNTDPTASLRLIPALISSGTVADSIERGGGGIGQATLNLRQLGSNRTLVLIDGYRHVSGVAGTQTVDVSTVPNALIERVDVLTGGASAVYGADAVTGVVNYVLKRDFEGLALDAQSGISSRGDGQSYRLEGTIGKNFGDGRGNITLSAGYTNDAEINLGARDFTRDNQRANNSTTYGNPDRRFQRGDINPATTPNFANFYRIGGPGASNTRFPFGPTIPTAAQVASFFPGVTLTAAEQALVARGANSPTFRIGNDPRFAISSTSGLVYRADFARFNLDLNSNGTPDCNESFIGRVVFGGGGCYVTRPGGGLKVFQDGLIGGNSNQFGGDGSAERFNAASLIPASERIYAVLRGNYEFSPAAEVFIDAKYARNNTTSRNPYNTFYDTVFIEPTNPFIPAALQGEANAAGGLLVSRDNTDLGPGITRSNRDTYRLVAGLRGELSTHFRYELVGNYGRTDNRTTFSNFVVGDRYLAAVDAVRAPNGQIVCRSSIDPTARPQSLGFPEIEGGFFTFRPGDGSCRPINLFNGEVSTTDASIAFITRPTTDRARLEQTVITLSFTGDTGGFFNLPGGAVEFAAGGEYREEKSRTTFDDADLGILPGTGPFAAGTNINTVSANRNLGLADQTPVLNAGGRFDVWEVFGEARLPILKDVRFFEELSVGGAGRFARYSTVGDTFTWNVNGTWAPVDDIRFRGTYGRSIRAPNIGELFDPQQGTVFAPNDPCEQSTIDRLVTTNDPLVQNRIANCRAAGIPAGFVNPNTARFPGLLGGNPTLQEETATTLTAGVILRPRFIPGLSISADYYSIKIRNAIQSVSSQDIVNTCYDLPTFPNSFCQQFTRNSNAASPTFRGLNFLTQSPINFAQLDTRGVDFQAGYRFSLSDYNFNINVGGNYTERLNRFFDPVRPNVANPGVGELSVPEWSGFASFNLNRGPLSFGYNLQYIKGTTLASTIQIERLAAEFGPAGLAPDYWIHSLSANFDVTDKWSFYGGVNNLTDEAPYVASSAYPVSGIGRFLFVGVRARY